MIYIFVNVWWNMQVGGVWVRKSREEKPDRLNYIFMPDNKGRLLNFCIAVYAGLKKVFQAFRALFYAWLFKMYYF